MDSPLCKFWNEDCCVFTAASTDEESVVEELLFLHRFEAFGLFGRFVPNWSAAAWREVSAHLECETEGHGPVQRYVLQLHMSKNDTPIKSFTHTQHPHTHSHPDSRLRTSFHTQRTQQPTNTATKHHTEIGLHDAPTSDATCDMQHLTRGRACKELQTEIVRNSSRIFRQNTCRNTSR